MDKPLGSLDNRLRFVGNKLGNAGKPLLFKLSSHGFGVLMTKSKDGGYMSLKAKIKDAMTQAMKSKEAERLQVIRNIWNAIRKKEIDDRKDLTDPEVEKIVMNLTKQLQESLDQANASARPDIATDVEKELKILKEFQPEMLSADQVSAAVGKIVEELKAAGTLPTGNAAMGMLMKKTMEVVGSRADGKIVQETVRKFLA